MSAKVLIKSDMYFSYNQFIIYDTNEKMPGCEWTDTHVNQGFARRESVVSFGTLLEFGTAKLRIYSGYPNSLNQYDRVIAVPFCVRSGKVNIEGPDEESDCRSIGLITGYYKLWCAQYNQEDETENIDLFFEVAEIPVQQSEILIADSVISPPAVLLESCGIADV